MLPIRTYGKRASANWRTSARWVSIVGHPFVTTLLLAWSVESHRGSNVAARTVVMVAVLFVLPVALLTARQVRHGAWTTVDASRPHERVLLYSVGGAGLVALLAYFVRANPGTPLVTGTAGVLIMLCICAAMTPWIKVSLHMAAAALTATILLQQGTAAGWLLAAALPVLGWSRFALGRHRWREIALGVVVGAVTGAALVRIG